MAQVEWSTPFMVCIIADEDIVPNTYEISIGLSPETDNVQYQNIGFERIKYFLRNICQNSVLISIHNDKFVTVRSVMNTTKFMTLPDEPYDQLIVVLLFQKINAILGKHFHCDYITLESFQGENVKYQFDTDYDGSFVEDKIYFIGELRDKKLPWWYRDDTTISDDFDKIEVNQDITWSELGLSFRKNKKKETTGEVINLKQFTPKVVDGKK